MAPQAQVGLFGKKGELPEPRAFVPGQYSAPRPSPRKALIVGGTPGDVRVAFSSSQDGDVNCSISFAAR